MRENVKKKKIILLNSFRPEADTLKQYAHRFPEEMRVKPHFFINKAGETKEIMDPRTTSNFFKPTKHEDSIIVSLENMGWMKRVPMTQSLTNSMGYVTGMIPTFQKKWRDYVLWDIYEEKQIDSLFELVMFLFDKMKIKKRVIGHNTKISRMDKVEGVVSRSNFNEMYTDVNPSFPFGEFKKRVEG